MYMTFPREWLLRFGLFVYFVTGESLAVFSEVQSCTVLGVAGISVHMLLQLSHSLLGRHIEGIWHTGIVVYNTVWCTYVNSVSRSLWHYNQSFLQTCYCSTTFVSFSGLNTVSDSCEMPV
jgi:hypothetical protein